MPRGPIRRKLSARDDNNRDGCGPQPAPPAVFAQSGGQLLMCASPALRCRIVDASSQHGCSVTNFVDVRPQEGSGTAPRRSFAACRSRSSSAAGPSATGERNAWRLWRETDIIGAYRRASPPPETAPPHGNVCTAAGAIRRRPACSNERLPTATSAPTLGQTAPPRATAATLGPILLGLGTFEAACVGMLSLLGVAKETLWRQRSC